MKLTLVPRKGPSTGRHREIELGSLAHPWILGRDPGPGGFLLEADSTVSRRHGQLLVEHGRLVYENLSPNGTLVDGTLALGRKTLESGSVLAFGQHEIEVRFARPASAAPGSDPDGAGASLWQHGPLARPAVRAALAVYLLGLLALSVVFLLRGPADPRASYLEARAEYADAYLPSLALDPREQARRLDRADFLAAELGAHVEAERWASARTACRRLMDLDGESESPLFRYAAQRLGELPRRR